MPKSTRFLPAGDSEHHREVLADAGRSGVARRPGVVGHVGSVAQAVGGLGSENSDPAVTAPSTATPWQTTAV